MAVVIRNIFTNKNLIYSLVPLSPTHFLKPLNSPFSRPNSRTHISNHKFSTSQHHIFPLTKINASFDELYGTSRGQVDGVSTALTGFNFDAFLSILEFLSLASSVAISLYVALSCGVSKDGILAWVGSKIFVWQSVVLVAGVVAGAVIRRRQWRRVSGAGYSRGSASYGANLLGRVEKMEEDLSSSATVIRVLSRQLEKLGTRVRATRKALKEPISETAALAQKTSEATRALAAQEDILENELGEIQKVLLAMQEQQHKQLELILAIGKARNLWGAESVPPKDQNASEISKSSLDGEPNLGINQDESLGIAKAI